MSSFQTLPEHYCSDWVNLVNAWREAQNLEWHLLADQSWKKEERRQSLMVTADEEDADLGMEKGTPDSWSLQILAF